MAFALLGVWLALALLGTNTYQLWTKNAILITCINTSTLYQSCLSRTLYFCLCWRRTLSPSLGSPILRYRTSWETSMADPRRWPLSGCLPLRGERFATVLWEVIGRCCWWTCRPFVQLQRTAQDQTMPVWSWTGIKHLGDRTNYNSNNPCLGFVCPVVLPRWRPQMISSMMSHAQRKSVRLFTSWH